MCIGLNDNYCKSGKCHNTLVREIDQDFTIGGLFFLGTGYS